MKEHIGRIFRGLRDLNSRWRRAELPELLALALTAGSGVVGFYNDCAAVREEVLRLHVIANSDSAEDQRIKLAVRDAVLQAGAEIFDGSVTAAQAEAKILPQKERLLAAARAVLRENGVDDTVALTVTKEYFDTRGAQLVVRDVPAAVRRRGDGRRGRLLYRDRTQGRVLLAPL